MTTISSATAALTHELPALLQAIPAVLVQKPSGEIPWEAAAQTPFSRLTAIIPQATRFFQPYALTSTAATGCGGPSQPEASAATPLPSDWDLSTEWTLARIRYNLWALHDFEEAVHLMVNLKASNPAAAQQALEKILQAATEHYKASERDYSFIIIVDAAIKEKDWDIALRAATERYKASGCDLSFGDIVTAAIEEKDWDIALRAATERYKASGKDHSFFTIVIAAIEEKDWDIALRAATERYKASGCDLSFGDIVTAAIEEKNWDIAETSAKTCDQENRSEASKLRFMDSHKGTTRSQASLEESWKSAVAGDVNIIARVWLAEIEAEETQRAAAFANAVYSQTQQPFLFSKLSKTAILHGHYAIAAENAKLYAQYSSDPYDDEIKISVRMDDCQEVTDRNACADAFINAAPAAMKPYLQSQKAAPMKK